MQVTDCYSEPHMFVEVSDLQPWVILSLNAGALKTTGETGPFIAFPLYQLKLPCRQALSCGCAPAMRYGAAQEDISQFCPSQPTLSEDTSEAGAIHGRAFEIAPVKLKRPWCKLSTEPAPCFAAAHCMYAPRSGPTLRQRAAAGHGFC